ncbi:HD family phosphohydrolase [Clostridium intestinale]|jgi:putative nucleotidyltransferase with HDIG domain|uniref:Metal dependent phosphohydrolase n=1 Tax=Clostridium intestinale URNW TaxID=1294142 RepID=U2N8P2_9CLOT|nr:HDIG domain-containing metalloprotein [Clostridium intestinale]ERK31887.1 metal dependent phosphohydrolase [Clostridium intestinale URNW]
MAKKLDNQRNIQLKRILTFFFTFLLAFLILMTAIVTKKYNLNPGDIANADIKAPRDTIDQMATKAKEDEVVQQIDKQYTLKTDVSKTAEESVKNFFQKIIALKDSTAQENDKIASIKTLNVVKLDDEDYKYLLSVSKEDITLFQNKSLEIIGLVYKKNIEEDKSEDIQAAKNEVENNLNNSGFNRRPRDILNLLITSQIKPNFFYDKEKTDEKIQEAQKNVPKIVIKKNQTIVKEGEPVTESQIELLNELGLLKNSGSGDSLYVYFVLGIFVAVILTIEYFYIYKYYRKIFDNTNNLILISIINIISLVLARSTALISPYLVPMIFGPIMLTLLLNYKISLVVSLLNCVLISGVISFKPEVMILAFVSCVLGSTSLRKMQQRNDILLSTAYIALMCAVLTFSTGTLLSNDMMEVLESTAMGGVGILLSGILAIGFLPVFETTFDIVTTVKLLELSNPNSPLLKKLLMEAPGTYHHSVLVSNLAELAAEEIGGNSVLARIGSFYHDIGKTKRPYFFKENQIGKDNPHDKITPNLSTLIITSHVKDGLEMAKEYNLPKVIRDIIAQHHGTTLVKYFYYKMKNSPEGGEEVKEADFRYPGPIPESKEAGIIMLADSVEAAVRSISEPTKGKIEEMVNNIIKDKLHSGQLDNCDLTLKDLTKIRQCFLKVLSGIYHERIEYPTEEKGVK